VPYEFVGSSYVADPYQGTGVTHYLPLPSGTQAGDHLLVFTANDYGFSSSDSRLTEYSWPGGGAGGGLWTGLADSSSDDVEIDDDGFESGLIYLVVVRGPDKEKSYAREDQLSGSYMSWQPQFGPLGGVSDAATGFAVCCSRDSVKLPLGPPAMGTDDDGEWTALDEVTRTDIIGGFTFNSVMRAYWLPAVSNIEDYILEIADVSGYSERRVSSTVYWSPPTRAENYLRQRQSPVRTPSRVRGIDLRQRQTPISA